MITVIVLLAVSYLIGGVPFGYLIARSRGVDLFTAGSGNIGATNVGRVVGRRFGILTFVLDFCKGALPTIGIVPMARWCGVPIEEWYGQVDVLQVGAGLMAFLGHLFPVYLKFRGGKGVATGAGVMAVLVPIPLAVSVLVWLCVVLATRAVSGASMASVLALLMARLAETRAALPSFSLVTLFVLCGTLIVIWKHRANIARLRAGTENTIAVKPSQLVWLRRLHLLAVGSWFGASLFFNIIAATPIFDAFKDVVREQPNDRTAFQRIQPETASETEKAALASALAGAAVGPLFPRYFVLAAICCMVVLITASGFVRYDSAVVHRWRLWLSVVACGLVALGWPLSEWVSKLRLERFQPDAELAAAAKAAFGLWHLVSLANGAVLTLMVGALLSLAATLPQEQEPAS